MASTDDRGHGRGRARTSTPPMLAAARRRGVRRGDARPGPRRPRRLALPRPPRPRRHGSHDGRGPRLPQAAAGPDQPDLRRARPRPRGVAAGQRRGQGRRRRPGARHPATPARRRTRGVGGWHRRDASSTSTSPPPPASPDPTPLAESAPMVARVGPCGVPSRRQWRPSPQVGGRSSPTTPSFVAAWSHGPRDHPCPGHARRELPARVRRAVHLRRCARRRHQPTCPAPAAGRAGAATPGQGRVRRGVAAGLAAPCGRPASRSSYRPTLSWSTGTPAGCSAPRWCSRRVSTSICVRSRSSAPPVTAAAATICLAAASATSARTTSAS